MCYAAAFSFALRLAATNYIDDRGVKTDTELVEQAIAGDLMLSDAIETNVQDIDDYEKEYDRMEQENPAGEVNYRHFVMLGRTSRLMVSIKHAIFGKLSERPIDF